MGALAGALAGIGERMHEENIKNQAAQLATNEHMAQFFEDQAKNAKTPEDQIALMQHATKYRGLGIKKPGKDLDPYTIMNEQYRKAAAEHMAAMKQQQQNPGPAAPTGSGGLAPAPNPQLTAPAPGGGMSQGPQAPTGIGGIAGRLSSFDQGAAAPQPQAAPAAPVIPKVIPGVSAQPGSDNPNVGTSGLPAPDPGFTTVAQANTPQHHDFWRSADEQQEFEARGAGLKQTAVSQAQNKAELDRAVATAVAERQLRTEDLKKIDPILAEFSKNPHPTMTDYARLEAQMSTVLGRPFQIPGIAALGRPRNIAGTVSGADYPDALDIDGNKTNPTAQYRLRVNDLTGDKELYPTVATTGRVVMPDKESPTGWSLFQVDRQGTVQGKTAGTAPPAAYAPIIRNGVREQVVDFGDHKELIPVNTQTSSQRTFPGMPAPAAGGGVTAPAAGAAASPKPPASLPAPTGTTPPAASGTFNRRSIGAKALGPAQVLPMKNSIEVASHQLWGDPDNPSLRPLASYSKLADNPAARDRLGTALRFVLDAEGSAGGANIGASLGPVSVSAGGIGQWIQNAMNVAPAVAKQRADMVRGVFEKMTPEEVDYFNSLMNAIPTITGFRKLTSGGAFRWSQQGLERELPMIGLGGVQNSRDFDNKMKALGDEPLTAIKNLERTNPGVVDSRLTELIRGKQAVAPPGVTPPAAKRPTNAEEYLRSLGR